MNVTRFRPPFGLTSLWLALLAAGCGGGADSPGTPTPPPPGATITIGQAGVSPKDVQITVGGRVRFINSDTRLHNMGSDPHPDHTDCPEINQVGFLLAGQSRETGNFVQVRTCGFHDHESPDTQSLRGTITIR
jgi:plastocyanin